MLKASFLAMKRRRVLASAFTCCPPGMPGFRGGEDVLGWNLVKQIARFHEVWVLTHNRDRAGLEAALIEEPDPALHFHYVGLPTFLRPLLNYQGGHQIYYYLWQIKAYLVARRLHEYVGFQLFHHITYANDWMTSFIGALVPIPYVRGPGGGAHRTPKGMEREYTLGGRIWENVRALGQWVFRHDPFFLIGQSRAAAILLCNRESLSRTPEKWAHKVHQFPVNGVSSRDLNLTTDGKTRNGQFRVLTAGSLIRVKGFGLAIRAFNEFAANHPNSSFQIVGSGPEESRLRSLIQAAQPGAQVQLLQAMPRPQLLATMAACDVFLFPSLRDGGGAVVIEAMSAGKPVICLDSGGPDVHVNDECGIKITPSSSAATVHELAGALERLYQNQNLRLAMGKAGRKRAELVYHWDRLGERLMEIYQQAFHFSAAS